MAGNTHIIGLTGSFGSGCTTIAKEILAKSGYEFISIGEILKERFRATYNEDPHQALRSKLQDFGDIERKQNGAEFYAQQAAHRIQAAPQKKWAIDGIRNPGEIRSLRDFSSQFYLFGIYADKERRWTRTKARYQGTRDEFERDDIRDSGREAPKHGQRVQDCFAQADVVISNDEQYQTIGNKPFQEFADKVRSYAQRVAKPLDRWEPPEHETHMTVAYATAQRSSCLKRKVGAVIVDASGAVISTGYNEVPKGEAPCKNEFSACYRDKSRSDYLQSVRTTFPQIAEEMDRYEEHFRSRFRILDLCRALHAEEQAILNLARAGSSTPFSECTLYTTTFPCRLCANKIVNVRLRKVVYVEPYPDDAAKQILAETETQFFQGVTYRGYSRIYGEEVL